MENDIDTIKKISQLLRYWILEMTTRAGSGHPTSSLSAVELMAVLLFSEHGFFRYDIADPDHPFNDRLIFSKGHASPLYYSLWAAAGALEPEELYEFRKFGSRLEGHPTRAFPFTEVPTGSLGQGLGVGMGMALSAREQRTENREQEISENDIQRSAYDAARTYVLLGDSEIAEGSVWEAAQLASYYKLGNLVALIDMNRLGQRGETMLGHDSETLAKRFETFGWRVLQVDGHDVQAIAQAYQESLRGGDVPVCIIAKTIKGKGVSFLEDANGWHGKALSEEEFEKAKEELGEVEFDVRGEIQKPVTSNFQSTTSIDKTDTNYKLQATSYELRDMVATRKVYGKALIEVGKENEDIVVLDAEVSNSTYAAEFQAVFPKRFFEMFIAEQNMVSVAVGMARRGSIPFVSSFGAFLTRAFDQIRMAQYAGVNMVVVGSHVGVSIGEDGASQMGLEDLAVFRSLLKSTVLYPSDAVSMMKLTRVASKNEGVTYIRTTRAETPVIYDADEEFVIGGSKVIKASANDQITLVTAGVTLPEAMQAADSLEAEGIGVRVIDMYSVKPVDAQTLIRAAKETGCILTIEDHYPEGGIGAAVREVLADVRTSVSTLCVNKIPKSGSPEELLRYEEIDAEAIIKKVRKLLEAVA